jgi:hypothetical protein
MHDRDEDDAEDQSANALFHLPRLGKADPQVCSVRDRPFRLCFVFSFALLCISLYTPHTASPAPPLSVAKMSFVRPQVFGVARQGLGVRSIHSCES